MGGVEGPGGWENGFYPTPRIRSDVTAAKVTACLVSGNSLIRKLGRIQTHNMEEWSVTCYGNENVLPCYFHPSIFYQVHRLLDSWEADESKRRPRTLQLFSEQANTTKSKMRGGEEGVQNKRTKLVNLEEKKFENCLVTKAGIIDVSPKREALNQKCH